MGCRRTRPREPLVILNVFIGSGKGLFNLLGLHFESHFFQDIPAKVIFVETSGPGGHLRCHLIGSVLRDCGRGRKDMCRETRRPKNHQTPIRGDCQILRGF